MAELVATLAKLVLLLEDTVHGSDGAKIHLCSATRIRTSMAAMYFVIIFDEFQDTNAEQLRVVQAIRGVQHAVSAS